MTAASPGPSAQSFLGWREWVALPLLGVPLVKVKVDTGARTCALHAFDLEEFQRDGVRWVRFTVRPKQDLVARRRPAGGTGPEPAEPPPPAASAHRESALAGALERPIRVECELLGERSVRSSAGQVEVRPVVRTEIQLGKFRIPIDLTLTNRDAMGFRMLLGRSAIRGRFVVDPSRSFVQRRPRSERTRTPRRRPAAPHGTAPPPPAPDPAPEPASPAERIRA